eukprot:1156744-Pelagomonas_calceolata.AAC.2
MLSKLGLAIAVPIKAGPFCSACLENRTLQPTPQTSEEHPRENPACFCNHTRIPNQDVEKSAACLLLQSHQEGLIATSASSTTHGSTLEHLLQQDGICFLLENTDPERSHRSHVTHHLDGKSLKQIGPWAASQDRCLRTRDAG